MRKKQHTKRSGFTVVELLISITILIIVVTIVSDVYLSTVGSQRAAFGRQDVLDSSRFSVESMARAIRQSSVVSVSQNELELNHPEKGQLRYTLEDGRIMEEGAPLTADSIRIDDLRFLGQGISPGDGEQPRITIVLVARSEGQRPSEESQLTVQTTITPRKLQTEE